MNCVKAFIVAVDGVLVTSPISSHNLPYIVVLEELHAFRNHWCGGYRRFSPAGGQ